MRYEYRGRCPISRHSAFQRMPYNLKSLAQNVKWSSSPGRHIPVQQPPVLSDLHLQSGLDVQQHLVLLSLAAQVGSKLHQLLLHAGHLALVASQRHGVAVRYLCQGALQRRFLYMDTDQPKESVRLLSDSSLDLGSGVFYQSVILYRSDDIIMFGLPC